MRAVLISIRPEWCEKILNGEKTVEVRKSAPKELPIKAYIYETKGKERGTRIKLYVPKPYGIDKVENFYSYEGRGKVIGEFICDKVEKFTMDYRQSDVNRRSKILKEACLSFEEATDYQNGAHLLYAWHISALKIYDKPRELAEFYSIKQCKPEYSPFGYQWTWEDRHKRNTGGWNNKYRPVPIECHRCKSLVGGKDYLDEKSGCILFDYECVSKYHKPIARPPQSWQYIEEE